MSKPILTTTIIDSTKTTRPKTAGMQRAWYIVDASQKPLGRVATEISNLLMGKNRADFSPDVDMGACVVVINASKSVVTGMKSKYKVYFSHPTSRPGSMKTRSFEEQIEIDPTRVIYLAVKRMLPKNRLQDVRMNQRLNIFADEKHNFSQKLIPSN